MNDLTLIKSETFGNVQCDFYSNDRHEALMTREQIGTALEYEDPMVAIGKVHDRHKERLDKFSFTTLVNGRNTYLYSAKGVYEICRWSQQPKADAFYDFVYETLEALRKGEAILQYQLPTTFHEALRMLADEVEHREQLQLENAQSKQIIGELRPKASYYDLILQNKTLVPITKISKDYGMSGQAMNALLHDLGIQYRMGDTWLLYQQYADQGLTQSRTHVIDADRSTLHTYWTQKGRLHLYDLLKNKRGLLPLIERQEKGA